MSKPSNTTAAAAATVVRPQDYAHSPVHYAVATGDHATLIKLLSSLPKLPAPTRIQTESDSLAQEALADRISSALDRRDNPLGETPLHLAVRLHDSASARLLSSAGADASLHNSAGWSPLQESVLLRSPAISSALVRHHHLLAWSKWRRRLPLLAAALRRTRDFYMEISFHFESSVLPFVGRLAPSDTYKIWKRDGNLRADTTLAGYDGLKIQRVNQTFLFMNDDNAPHGSLLIIDHDHKRITDAFENAGNPLSDADISNFCNQTSVYRPGLDVTKAELISRTNWRRQEKIENVGEWKAKVYEMHNVICTLRSRKVQIVDGFRDDPFSSTCILPLEIDDGSDDGFIVAENPRFSSVSNSNGGNQRRHSSFVKEETEFVTVSRKSVDIIPADARRRAAAPCTAERLVAPPKTKEKEHAKSVRPTVWLTEKFPLRTEELLPLLDILANKIKAVRRVREVLTTTFPQGTFPVKVAIPVVPTVQVVITFTKFVELQPLEDFYTPLSSPRQFPNVKDSENQSTKNGDKTGYFSLSSSWLKGGGPQQQSASSGGREEAAVDPFAIPSGYVWGSFDDKVRKMKRAKSTRKTK